MRSLGSAVLGRTVRPRGLAMPGARGTGGYHCYRHISGSRVAGKVHGILRVPAVSLIALLADTLCRDKGSLAMAMPCCGPLLCLALAYLEMGTLIT